VEQRVARERGEPVTLSCFYNDRGEDGSPPSPELAGDQRIRDAVAASSWAEEFEGASTLPTVPLFMNIDHSPSAIELVASFDCRFFDIEDVAGIARGVELAAVQTALMPNAPTGLHQRESQPV
jgi:hypothetical protein